MTPNDLYSECVPHYTGRRPNQHMYFPLVESKPNRFLSIPNKHQSGNGNRSMVRTNRVKALLRRLGL